MRADLAHNGVTGGFQWLDGSFLEDIETTERRVPKDIDVVTFYSSTDPGFTTKLASNFPELQSPAQMKAVYLVDHYTIDLNIHPAYLVDATRYWYGLFSHTRNDVWKGMLRLELGTRVEDKDADDFLAAWTPFAEGTL